MTLYQCCDHCWLYLGECPDFLAYGGHVYECPEGCEEGTKKREAA